MSEEQLRDGIIKVSEEPEESLLEYTFVESSEKLDKAFSILFDEVMKDEEIYAANKNNHSSNILPSIYVNPRRPEDD